MSSSLADLEVECGHIEEQLKTLENKSMLRRHFDEAKATSARHRNSPPEQQGNNPVVRLAHRLQWLVFVSREWTPELRHRATRAQAGLKVHLQEEFRKNHLIEILLALVQFCAVEFVSADTRRYSTCNLFYTSPDEVVLELKFHPTRRIPLQDFHQKRANYLGTDNALGIYAHGLPSSMTYLQQPTARISAPSQIYNGVCRTEADLRLLAANFDRLQGNGKEPHVVVSIIDSPSSVLTLKDIKVLEICGVLYSFGWVKTSGETTRVPCEDSVLRSWYQVSLRESVEEPCEKD